MLLIENVYAGYRDFDILKGVNLKVNPGEIVCVIGPNGAGKSTVFKAIYGLVKIRQGRVIFGEQNITNLRPQQILQAGVAIVPQMRSVFPQMSVRENLELGMYLEKNQQRIQKRIDYVLELFPKLAQRQYQQAGTMSGGEQRMLEIGRSLMLEPKLVMMDEPSAGLSPSMTKMIFENIVRLNQEIGLTVLAIEQNARQGLESSHRGYVLELGKNTFEGVASELLQDQEVRRSFLGG
ncbi:MAG: ABC transporter ATP-binding protein [Xenococcaceae cyanobacterium MO_188.B29]|nr:ABC transporter ATP-binding protein [Xenococcaceae cyanobacterium MO_188.B29]